MSKFHVNKETGVVGKCSATKKRCPLGDEDVHFASEEEAKKFSEKMLSTAHPNKTLQKKVGKLIVFVGVPGSGKTTIAKKLAEDVDGVIVNRDDQRTEMFGESYHKKSPDGKSEAAVTAILRNRMLKALREGRTVIDDNTNTNPRFLSKLVSEARKVGAEIEFRSLDVSVEIAKERNRKRGAEGGRLVPEHVIDSMAKNIYDENGRVKDVVASKHNFIFLLSKETRGMKLLEEFAKEQETHYPIVSRNSVIVDIDGTLAMNQHLAEKYLRQKNVKKDFGAFYTESAHVQPNRSVLELTQAMRKAGFTLFALTGRTDDYASPTIDFLKRANAPLSRAYMAREGDFRGDHDTKVDNVAKIEEAGFQIVHAIDDRPTSIEVWQNKGVLVSAVPYGESDFYPKDGSEPQVNSLFMEGFCLKCGKETSSGYLHKSCSADE